MSSTVTRPEDVPDAHKIAVYEAMRRYFESALDSYFTRDEWSDPRYDTGTAAERTECIGIEAAGDGLYVVMAIRGWADLYGFSVDLPRLERYDRVDDGVPLRIQEK